MNESSLLSPDKWNHTYPNKKTFHFKWTLHDLPLVINNCKKGIANTKFEFNYNCLNFSVYLDVLKITLNLNQHLQAYIKLCPSCDNIDKKWHMPIELSIVDSKGNKTKTFKEYFNNYSRYAELNIISLSELLKNKEYLPNDNLTLSLEITIIDFKTIYPDAENVEMEVTEPELHKYLVEIYENKLHADVTLVADGQEFLGHKCILASRSKVFAAMFEHQMQENQTNIVNITNINADVLKEMLQYIYTGKVSDLNKMAIDLYAASDQYDLKYLQNMCEVEMSKNITVENAVEILLTADLYNSKCLKDIAIKYINTNAARVVKTEAWQNMAISHGHLLTELYLKLSK